VCNPWLGPGRRWCAAVFGCWASDRTQADDLEQETSDTAVERIREPANDFMRILGDEWRALVPRSWQEQIGRTIAAPEALTLRLYGHQLNRNLGIQGSGAFSPRSIVPVTWKWRWSRSTTGQSGCDLRDQPCWMPLEA